MEPLYKKQKLSDHNYQLAAAPSIASELPAELLLTIFSHLNSLDWHKTIQVDVKWNKLSVQVLENYFFLEHPVILTPNKWNMQFENNCISEEESDEAFATMRLDLDLIPSPSDSSKKLIDTHVIAYIPKEIRGEKLSMDSYGELLKIKFPDNLEGYHRIWTGARNFDERKKKNPYVCRKEEQLFGGYRDVLWQDLRANGAKEYGWMALSITRKSPTVSEENGRVPLLIPTIAILSMHYFNTENLMFQREINVSEISFNQFITVKMTVQGVIISGSGECERHYPRFNAFFAPLLEL